MEIQIASPFAEQAQALAAAHHVTPDAYISALIREESIFHEIEKAQQRKIIAARYEEVLRGETIPADDVFDRLEKKIYTQAGGLR